MNKILFRTIVMVLTFLSIGYASEVSAQCNKGYQQLIDTVGTVHEDSNSAAKAKAKVFQPQDPNEIVGLDGYDEPGTADSMRWVSATQTLAYTVYFENDADFATAAASKTMVTHSNVFDFNEAILPNTGPYILL